MRRSPVLSILSGWSLMMSGDLDAVERPARRRRTRRWPPAPTTRTSRPRGRTPRICAPRRRRSRSTARRWPRHAATSPAPCAMPGARWTWPDPRTTSCAVPAAGSSAWPPGRPGTSSRRCPRSPRRSAACTPRGTWSTSWTARSCSPTCGSPPAGPAAPAGCTSRRCRRRPGTVSRTRGPPPTCTSGWPSSTVSSTTSRAPRHTSRRRESSVNEAPSPRTGTGGSWPWRRCAPPAATTTPRRSLLDQAEALYRRGFYPDIRPIAAMKARVQIAEGDLSSAAGWAARPRRHASMTTPTTCASTST